LRAEAGQACQLLRETWDDLDHLKDECLRLGIPIGPTRKRVMQALRVVETLEDAYEKLSGSPLRPNKRAAPTTGERSGTAQEHRAEGSVSNGPTR
jgi:hypothetical protein